MKYWWTSVIFFYQLRMAVHHTFNTISLRFNSSPDLMQRLLSLKLVILGMAEHINILLEINFKVGEHLHENLKSETRKLILQYMLAK